MKSFSLIVLLLYSLASQAQVDIYDSGGPLMPEQAAFDVQFYELSLEVKPEQQWLG